MSQNPKIFLMISKKKSTRVCKMIFLIKAKHFKKYFVLGVQKVVGEGKFLEEKKIIGVSATIFEERAKTAGVLIGLSQFF